MKRYFQEALDDHDIGEDESKEFIEFIS